MCETSTPTKIENGGRRKSVNGISCKNKMTERLKEKKEARSANMTPPPRKKANFYNGTKLSKEVDRLHLLGCKKS